MSRQAGDGSLPTSPAPAARGFEGFLAEQARKGSVTVASVLERVLRKYPEETDVDDELERLIQGIGGLIDHRFPD